MRELRNCNSRSGSGEHSKDLGHDVNQVDGFNFHLENFIEIDYAVQRGEGVY